MSIISNYVSQITDPVKPNVKGIMDAVASRALDSRYFQYLNPEHTGYLKAQLPDISDSTLFAAAIARDLKDDILCGCGSLKDIPKAFMMKYWSSLDCWANNDSHSMVEKKHVDKSVLRAEIESIFEKRNTGSKASANGV